MHKIRHDCKNSTRRLQNRCSYLSRSHHMRSLPPFCPLRGEALSANAVINSTRLALRETSAREFREYFIPDHSNWKKHEASLYNGRDGKEKRDSSLRRPTLSQERKRKKKSACSVRNDGRVWRFFTARLKPCPDVAESPLQKCTLSRPACGCSGPSEKRHDTARKRSNQPASAPPASGPITGIGA